MFGGAASCNLYISGRVTSFHLIILGTIIWAFPILAWNKVVCPLLSIIFALGKMAFITLYENPINHS
ncbi:S ribonuclease [Pyrus ussuriensis x Pyrus communis]|uniref:S ribonuclease n=1 Tax=Pyrus ussuriensis x Pyrus communis TaxID=2448454 RepID=A0A5N5HQM3_9ROSA|nr:S ribonuclease [Pyrus ussuriensis x Pyrus communis]